MWMESRMIRPCTTTIQTEAKIHPFHQATPCIDVTSPSWDESHVDVNIQHNGSYKMDGFVKVASHTGGSRDPLGHRAMGYYDQRDLPFYYELATQYATSDRWFAPELANTIPNRMYLFTGTSYGTTYPEVPTAGSVSAEDDLRGAECRGSLLALLLSGQQHILGVTTRMPGAILTYSTRCRPISEYFSLLAGNSTPEGDTTLAQVVFIERGSGSAETRRTSGRGTQMRSLSVAATRSSGCGNDHQRLSHQPILCKFRVHPQLR